MNLKSMFINRKSLFHWYWQLWPPIHNHHQHCLQKNISSIRNSIGKMLLISLILVQLISDCLTVRIVRHWINQSVDSRNYSNSIIMDCDYQYDPEEDIKLVVRWFYNDWPEPIYQWIPGNIDNNRYIGQSIRPYFDMNFQIGDDKFTKYRAIRLMPSSQSQSQSQSQSTLSFDLELSGNYTCVISSIMSQDSRQGQLIFYVPPEKFEFNIFSNGGRLNFPTNFNNNDNNLSADDDNNDDDDRPMVRCQAHNVYPKPLLSFSELIADDTISTMTINQHQSSPYSQFKQTFPRINVQTIISNESNQNQPQTKQLYTSWFEYRLKIDSIKVGTIFECRLEIPTTNYIRKKRIKLIYPSTYLNGLPSSQSTMTTTMLDNNNRWSRQYGIGGGQTKQLTDYQAQLHHNQQRNWASHNNHNHQFNLIMTLSMIMIISWLNHCF
ncbi:hypothetical protein DERP_014826 [Dermatophagoides pteronyssinus]|uniref:Ig-like domain-containing protein n=1 Tax=Dermatophagoides pteronyssinus TaxID=6956 RepID=A0ABQ8J2Y3_DERPT|nr:hypothetical protein DERP_014826 [Dermatophagoides pteronyssinus]